jgi:hypothetical protein
VKNTLAYSFRAAMTSQVFARCLIGLPRLKLPLRKCDTFEGKDLLHILPSSDAHKCNINKDEEMTVA